MKVSLPSMKNVLMSLMYSKEKIWLPDNIDYFK